MNIARGLFTLLLVAVALPAIGQDDLPEHGFYLGG
jgi:hypothetical protein